MNKQKQLESLAKKINPQYAILTRNRRTADAISGTYRPKQPTKKRRKLPNGRKWKNKKIQYKTLNAKMAKENFNAKQVLNRLVPRYNSLLRSIIDD